MSAPFISDKELAWFRAFNQFGFNPDCTWCLERSKPCVGCAAKFSQLQPKADAEFRRQFPDGMKPIATFDTTTEAGRNDARQFISKLVGASAAAEIVALAGPKKGLANA